MVNEDLQVELDLVIEFDELDKSIELASDSIFTDFVADGLLELRNELEEASESAMQQVAEATRSLQQQYIAMHGNYRTGRLLESITVEGGGNSYSVGTNIDHFYPTVIEKGRRDVYPIDHPYLQWVNLDGSWVRTKHSSAVAPSPFVEPTIQIINQRIPVTFKEELKNV